MAKSWDLNWGHLTLKPVLVLSLLQLIPDPGLAVSRANVKCYPQLTNFRRSAPAERSPEMAEDSDCAPWVAEHWLCLQDPNYREKWKNSFYKGKT